MAIIGSYCEGHLKTGKEGMLTGIRYDKTGLPVPRVKQLQNSREVTYEFPGATYPAKNLLLRDLYDILHVYIAQSRIEMAGEGLFARTNISEGSLVALFNGVRKRKLRRTVIGYHSEDEFSDYAIGVDKQLTIDIPPYYIPAHRYCATLAHKACHSFKNNSHFDHLEHPRFGRIMAIVATQNISRGEEILVHYGYTVQTAPDWYRKLWFRHLKKEYGWSEEDVMRYGVTAARGPTALQSIHQGIQRRANKQ
jgi:hypothetical protein